MVDLRTLSVEELNKALFMNITWQQKWSRKLERIIYLNEAAPPLFIKYGNEIIMEHQDKVSAIEEELERRGRIQVFKDVVQLILSYDTLQ